MTTENMTPAPCQLVGTDGNIYALLATAEHCLERADRRKTVNEMTSRVFASQSYDEAILVLGDYVTMEISDDND